MDAWTIESADRDTQGFTLLELLLALVIISVVATAALYLQQQSLRSWERSSRLTRAVLLAQEKMAEAQFAAPAGGNGLTRGADAEGGISWELQVTDGPLAGLSTVRVRVWAAGQAPPLLEASTYVVRP